MNIMIIGNGGREHALRWKLSQNKNIKKIFSHGDLHELMTLEDYCDFAKKNNVDLTIVGSEDMLVKGIVDVFKENNLRIFGPDKSSARLEGSKSFAKVFMTNHNVKTAKYNTFENCDEALNFIERVNFPIVIKADGLAGGKGVFIANEKDEAKNILKELFVENLLGEAGKNVVIEEFLDGIEASILSIYDGEKIVPFISAKDHKKIDEGEIGLNTGGMGVIAPNPYVTKEVWDEFVEKILIPTQNGLREKKFDFIGVIFFGLMITKNGVYLLEYNMRLGDPETQAILPLMESDLLDVLSKAMNGNLDSINWKNMHSCCVVAASKGYPLKYETGHEINGMHQIKCNVFNAGIKYIDNIPCTSGGRVLSVVGVGDSLAEARETAYANLKKINFKGMYYRKDI